MAFLSVPFRFQNIPSLASWATCSALYLVWGDSCFFVCLFFILVPWQQEVRETSCRLALCTTAVTWQFTPVKYLVTIRL